MKNLSKYLWVKMRARSKVNLVAGLVLVMLLSIGCSTSVDEAEVPSEEETDVSEVTEEVNNDSEVEVEPEVKEEVEVLPVPRKTSLEGGQEVVTPKGITINSLELSTNNNYSFSYIELSGLEVKKSYDISLSGNAEQETIISAYLIDGNLVDVNDDINIVEIAMTEGELNIADKKVNGVILDSMDVYVASEFDEFMQLTNAVRTTSKGVLYLVYSSNDEVSVDEVKVQRHIGELKFSDEFDYDGLPNEDWTYELGGNGWGNGELQYYTGADIDNASVSAGALTITAMEESIDNNDYSSARMRTKDSFKYGRYEIKAKLPYGRGTWPAIWMLPAGNNYGNWPNSGEIDIMEHVGHDMDVVHGSLHMAAFNFRKNNHPSNVMSIPNVDTQYHTYTLEWTPYQIDMYIDQYLYMSFKNDGQGPKHWPYDEKFYLLLNIAVGGAWGGQEGVDPIFPQEMMIDYVRIYELEDELVDFEAPEAITEAIIDVQGATVFYEFEPVEDNYKVAYYTIELTNGSDNITSSTNNTNGFVFGLEAQSTYNISISAVDEAGNIAVAYETSVDTQTITVNSSNEWVTPEQSYFVSGATISELDSDNYIAGFETDDLMGYRFDIAEAGKYQLELEISGKLFDGEIMLLNQNQEELLSFVATKTGDKEVYEIVVTDGFSLESGEQTIFLKTIKNGYQIKNVRLINMP